MMRATAALKCARDSLPVLRQEAPRPPGGVAHFMPSLKSHARWGEALRSTLALWLFVLLIFLPVIVRRHAGEPWTGVAIDCSTIIVSIGFAMIMFLASRATIDLPAIGPAAAAGARGARRGRREHAVRPDLPGLDRQPSRRGLARLCRPISPAPIPRC